MLKKGFNGIKTGITPAAGPCMATSFARDNIHLIVIVLDCKNVQNRCDDSVKLTFWAYNRLSYILEHFKKSPSGSKTDETTASSGQSSNSQKKQILKSGKSSKKIAKNWSRRFTAEKRRPEEGEEEKKLNGQEGQDEGDEQE